MAAITEGSTWAEERQEVWQSIIEAMRSPDVDADRASACCYLLRHILACPAGASAMMYS